VRRSIALLVLVVFTLGGCDQFEEILPPEPEPVAAPTRTDRPAPEECAEVSASQGAPAPITMKDTFFDPFCLAVSTTQQLTLTNAGDLLHNLSIGETQLDVDVEPGEEITTDDLGTEARPGTFRFVCKYHEARGMVGTITIE
jgi:plastocyanin